MLMGSVTGAGQARLAETYDPAGHDGTPGGIVMSHAMDLGRNVTPPVGAERVSIAARRAYHAYVLLHIGYAVLPIVAGVDKCLHYLVNWDGYLAPVVTRVVPVTAHNLMLAVGAIEVVAGLLVAIRPHIGAYVVALWLWGIIVNLLLIPGFYDIALRDFGLSLEALALAWLAREFEFGPTRTL
jgi:hypothetical protein